MNKQETRAAIAAAMQHYGQRSLGQIMRDAWDIRKRAAIRWQCSVSEIHWGTCLRIAWARGTGTITVLKPRNARGLKRAPTARARHAVGHRKYQTIRSDQGKSGFVSRVIARGQELEKRSGIPLEMVPRQLVKGRCA